MRNCERCGRQFPVLTKINVMRSDETVFVCTECKEEIERANAIFAKVQVICCFGVGLAAAVIFIIAFIILFTNQL
jgi:DNA-directed RNA polymerase subunit RPC12/RpoP